MEIALTLLILSCAAFVQGFLGFGFGIIAMGGLGLLVDPWYAAGVVNLTGILQTGWLAFLLRDRIDWRTVGRILPASVIGIALGLFVLHGLPTDSLLRLLGVTILLLGLWNLTRRPPQRVPSTRWELPVGLASGILTGLFNTGGPPIVAYLYRRPDPPETLIATVQALFLFTALTRLPGAFALGMLTPPVYSAALAGGLFVMAGVWFGRVVGRRLSPDRFRTASWLALSAFGSWLILAS